MALARSKINTGCSASSDVQQRASCYKAVPRQNGVPPGYHVATRAELEVDDLYTCMFASRITTSAASTTHTRYGDRGTTADEAGQFGHTVICDSARLQSLQQQQQPGVLAQGGVPPVVVQCVAVQQPEYQTAVPGSTVVTATVVSTPVAASRTGYADGSGTAGAVAARTCMLEGIFI